jgi:hypothetical protein
MDGLDLTLVLDCHIWVIVVGSFDHRRWAASNVDIAPHISSINDVVPVTDARPTNDGSTNQPFPARHVHSSTGGVQIGRTERRSGSARPQLPSMHHVLLTDPDDHHGGAAWWRAADARQRGQVEDSPTSEYTTVGLVLSQVLTLYTTPVVFLYLDRLTRRSLQVDMNHPLFLSAKH